MLDGFSGGNAVEEGSVSVSIGSASCMKQGVSSSSLSVIIELLETVHGSRFEVKQCYCYFEKKEQLDCRRISD